MYGGDGGSWTVTAVGGDGGPALIWVYAYPDEHGKIKHEYFRKGPMYGKRELAAIVALIEGGRPLTVGILRTCLQLRGLLMYLNRSELPLWQDLNAARLIFRGCGVAARQMAARKELRDEQEGGSEKRGSKTILFCVAASDFYSASCRRIGRLACIGKRFQIVGSCQQLRT